MRPYLQAAIDILQSLAIIFLAIAVIGKRDR